MENNLKKKRNIKRYKILNNETSINYFIRFLIKFLREKIIV